MTTSPGSTGDAQLSGRVKTALVALSGDGLVGDVLRAVQARDELVATYMPRWESQRNNVEQLRLELERAQDERLPDVNDYPQTVRDARRRQRDLTVRLTRVRARLADAGDPSLALASPTLLTALKLPADSGWKLGDFIAEIILRMDQAAANSRRGMPLTSVIEGPDAKDVRKDVLAAIRDELSRMTPGQRNVAATLNELGETLKQARAERDAAVEGIKREKARLQQEERQILEELGTVGEEIERLNQERNRAYQEEHAKLAEGERRLRERMAELNAPIIRDANDIVGYIMTVVREVSDLQPYTGQIRAGFDALVQSGGTEEVREYVNRIDRALVAGNVQQALADLGRLPQVLESAIQAGGGTSGASQASGS